jgi:hypothetical protein
LDRPGGRPATRGSAKAGPKPWSGDGREEQGERSAGHAGSAPAAAAADDGRAQSPPGGPIIASESAPNGPLAARQVLALGGTAALAAAGDGRALAVWSTGSAIAAAQRPATP